MDGKKADKAAIRTGVSVIIPLYNKESTVVRAIQSILGGSVLPDEIVVVDDGSTDDSLKALATVRSPLLRVISQKNKGAAAARNTGIREASGELIAFLDADDVWLPDFLQTVLALKQDFPNAGLYGTAYAVCQDGETISVSLPDIPPHPWKGVLDNLFALFLSRTPFNSDTVLIPRAVFDETGFFMEGETIGEDVQMWLNISLRYPIIFTTKVCSHYHTDAPNRAYVKTKALHAAGYARWLDETAKTVSPERRAAVLKLRENVELGRLSSLVSAGERKQALDVYRAFPFREYRNRARMWAVLALLPRPLYLALLRTYQKSTSKNSK